MPSKNRPKIRTSVFFLFILIIISITFVTLFNLEIERKPYVKDKFESLDINYLKDFYIEGAPNLDGRLFFGKKDANTHLIAYMSIGSESSKYFIFEIFPKLKKEYIDTGKLKFYPKSYVTLQDFEEKNDNFYYAKSLFCIRSIKEEKYFDFYFDLFEIANIKEIQGLLKKHNISKSQFNQCVEEKEFDELLEDASEVEHFGIVGLNQRFYIGLYKDNTALNGVPNYNKFNITIRQYLFTIGN